MARHAEIAEALGAMEIYFCDPHSPWQRPTNENTNGLLRDYFPKGSDLSVHTADAIAHVQAELNRRPRKILGWDSPADRHGYTPRIIVRVATLTGTRLATSGDFLTATDIAASSHQVRVGE